MSRLVGFGRRYGFDLLIVAGALGSALQVALRGDSGAALDTPVWFAAPAISAVVLLLLGRRLGFAAPASVWLLAATLSFVDGRLVGFTAGVLAAGMAASFLLGGLPDAAQGRVGLAVVLGGAAIIAYNEPTRAAGDFVFLPALFGFAWLAGFALREHVQQAEAAERRAARAERDRETAARLAAAEERARIARELHDIVAHAVTVMVLQTGAIRHRLPAATSRDREALVGIEETGRGALEEMRRLLGALRHDGEKAELAPQPGLAGLDSLAAEFGRVGLPVRLQVDGEPFPLPGGLDLSAYRIVQEGLTNALKHAHASHADVVVRYAPDELQIDVRDDGDGGSIDNGLGHGLVGVRERVKIYGGEVIAGNTAAGGFELKTRLPLERPRR